MNNSRGNSRNDNKNFGTILTNDEEKIKVDGGSNSHKSTQNKHDVKRDEHNVISTGYDNDFVDDFNEKFGSTKENAKPNTIHKEENKNEDQREDKYEKKEKYDYSGGNPVNFDNKHGNNASKSNGKYENKHENKHEDKYEDRYEDRYDDEKNWDNKHQNQENYEHKHEKHEEHNLWKPEHETHKTHNDNKHSQEWECEDVLCDTEFSCNCNPINEALADIVESIAHQENGIAKILDSESKKICRAICMAECVDDLLKVNKSVQDTIKQINNVQIVLISKLQEVSDICDGCYDDDCGSN